MQIQVNGDHATTISSAGEAAIEPSGSDVGRHTLSLGPTLDRMTMRAPPSYTVEQIDPQSRMFDQVLALRGLAYRREEAGKREEIDDYSIHLIARHDDVVLGALRVTCYQHGPFESHDRYPRWLLDEFGDRMSAASRMCIRPELAGCSSIPHDLTVRGWSTVLPMGVRIDVSKARLKAIPYYMRMGYVFVQDSIFRFHHWDAMCGLIVYPANAAHRGQFWKVFENIDSPCDLLASVNANRFSASYRDVRRASEAAI